MGGGILARQMCSLRCQICLKLGQYIHTRPHSSGSCDLGLLDTRTKIESTNSFSPERSPLVTSYMATNIYQNGPVRADRHGGVLRLTAVCKRRIHFDFYDARDAVALPSEA
jgi:hypothetical protein